MVVVVNVSLVFRMKLYMIIWKYLWKRTEIQDKKNSIATIMDTNLIKNSKWKFIYVKQKTMNLFIFYVGLLFHGLSSCVAVKKNGKFVDFSCFPVFRPPFSFYNLYFHHYFRPHYSTYIFTLTPITTKTFQIFLFFWRVF